MAESWLPLTRAVRTSAFVFSACRTTVSIPDLDLYLPFRLLTSYFLIMLQISFCLAAELDSSRGKGSFCSPFGAWHGTSCGSGRASRVACRKAGFTPPAIRKEEARRTASAADGIRRPAQ